MDNDPFAEHYAIIRRYVRRYYACTAEDADDLTQATYAKAYAHVKKYGAPTTPLRFLKVVARSVAIDQYRRVLPWKGLERLAGAADLVDTSTPGPVSHVCDREERERLPSLIRNLSPLERRLFIGYYLDGRSACDLSRRWYVSKTAVRVRLYRARRKLRALLEE